MDILNNHINLIELATQKKEEYISAEPFPSIYFDNFFNPEFLDLVLGEFPDMAKNPDIHFNNYNEIKYASKGERKFGENTKAFVHFLNSEPFLLFLQELTSIKEILLPDPYFEGGGFHEIKKGGLLKLHADFNKHAKSKLDRRLNVLVYLNKDWKEEYGGHFEMWDKEMKECHKKILPIFNRMAMFSTTSHSFHGHPNPLTCPDDRSRKSVALYYYTNGRPQHEIDSFNKDHSTIFVGRTKEENAKIQEAEREKISVRDFVPPVFGKIKRNILSK